MQRTIAEKKLAPLVAQYGGRVKPVTLEVRDETAAKAAVQSAVDTFGRLDVLAVMRRQKSGHIFQVSSLGRPRSSRQYAVSGPQAPDYEASVAAIFKLLRSVEGRSEPIRERSRM